MVDYIYYYLSVSEFYSKHVALIVTCDASKTNEVVTGATISSHLSNAIIAGCYQCNNFTRREENVEPMTTS